MSERNDDLDRQGGDVAVIRTPVRLYQPARDGHGSVRFRLERETVLTFYRWISNVKSFNEQRAPTS